MRPAETCLECSEQATNALGKRGVARKTHLRVKIDPLANRLR